MGGIEKGGEISAKLLTAYPKYLIKNRIEKKLGKL